MKKILIASISLLIPFLLSAQIDRDKMPEPTQMPTFNLGDPYIKKLPNGLTLMIVEDHKLPRVSVSLTLDRPPIDETNKPGMYYLTSELMGGGSKNISKEAFVEETDRLGATVYISMDGGSTYSLTRYFPRVLELFADAAIHPNFTQAELDKARDKAIASLKAEENSAQSIIYRLNSALTYGKKHPYGSFYTEKSLKSITLKDITNFYKTYFSPSSAYMVVVGDVNTDEVEKLVIKNFHDWLPAKSLQMTTPTPNNVQYTQVNLVDVPSAVQTEISAFNLYPLKMSDKDFFAVKVMNYILGGDYGSYININLREQHGYTYGARSYMGTNRFTLANFFVSVRVRNEVAAKSVVEILKEIKRIQNEDVTAQKLEEVKGQLVGRFVMSTQYPSTIANLAVTRETQKLPADFYSNYIKNIEAVTIADVKRVANKYIKYNNLRFIIVGKASEFEKELKQLKFNGKALPVFYYDKYANKIK
ncbi:pitrilysin family protein [Capnocytophaga sp. G2]|uniref:M16 family metallopeptidase n=1 Tax=Capnocytophaga sp. G2 TaxID=3110695 RepID=UPI002B478A90|nr:pitrilysin family protein [Capnocytophaga sp. G2]MEB3005318.1 pitrilysin family protein [Capnocytophaga sp. G2]